MDIEIEEKVRKGLLANGIKERIKNIAIKDPCLQGEGFLSQARYATVQFEDTGPPDMNLFAKILTTNDTHNQMVDEMKAFEKESTFLTKYVPAADEMCKRKGVEGASELFPKCYYGDSSLVLLENLVLNKGFGLLAQPANLNEARLAMITLAKHHAISYAMIRDVGGPDKFFQQFPNLDWESFDKPNFRKMLGGFLDKSLESNVTILEKFEVEGRDEALSILKPFIGQDLMTLMIGGLKHKQDELLVLCHGDYWGNNMMFLRNDQGLPVGHKAIDLQMTRYNSPVLDILKFLFISVQANVRISHLQEILLTYLDVLLQTSSHLGHKIPINYDQLYKTFCSKITFGFLFGMCTTLGMGMQATKDFDVNTIDTNDWSRVMNSMLQKWISENPQHSEAIAKEVVQVALEFKRLSSV